MTGVKGLTIQEQKEVLDIINTIKNGFGYLVRAEDIRQQQLKFKEIEHKLVEGQQRLTEAYRRFDREEFA